MYVKERQRRKKKECKKESGTDKQRNLIIKEMFDKNSLLAIPLNRRVFRFHLMHHR